MTDFDGYLGFTSQPNQNVMLFRRLAVLLGFIENSMPIFFRSSPGYHGFC